MIVVHTLDGKCRAFDGATWEVSPEGILFLYTKRQSQWETRKLLSAYPLTSIERWTDTDD